MQLAQVFVRTRRSLPASDPSLSEVRIPETPLVPTVGVPLEVRTSGDCGPDLRDLDLLICHRTMARACPRRTGPKGELAPPLDSRPPRLRSSTHSNGEATVLMALVRFHG